MKPTRNPEAESHARAATLTALRDAGPRGLSRAEIRNYGGESADSRVGELRDLGWPILGDMRGGTQYYVLTGPRSDGLSNSREVVVGVKVRITADGVVHVDAYGTAKDGPASHSLASHLEPYVRAWVAEQEPAEATQGEPEPTQDGDGVGEILSWLDSGPKPTPREDTEVSLDDLLACFT